MFWNILNLILWREPGNKRLSCFDDYKSDAFIPVQSAQHFKIQSHFGIYDPEIGEGWWYDDAAAQAIERICELFVNILFLYSM